MSKELLARAINLIKAGQKDQARPLLMSIIQIETANIMAWIWLAECLPTDPQRVRIMQKCLQLNPGNELARKAMAQYITRAEATPPAPGGTAPFKAPTPPSQTSPFRPAAPTPAAPPSQTSPFRQAAPPPAAPPSQTSPFRQAAPPSTRPPTAPFKIATPSDQPTPPAPTPPPSRPPTSPFREPPPPPPAYTPPPLPALHPDYTTPPAEPPREEPRVTTGSLFAFLDTIREPSDSLQEEKPAPPPTLPPTLAGFNYRSSDFRYVYEDEEEAAPEEEPAAEPAELPDYLTAARPRNDDLPPFAELEQSPPAPTTRSSYWAVSESPAKSATAAAQEQVEVLPTNLRTELLPRRRLSLPTVKKPSPSVIFFFLGMLTMAIIGVIVITILALTNRAAPPVQAVIPTYTPTLTSTLAPSATTASETATPPPPEDTPQPTAEPLPTEIVIVNPTKPPPPTLPFNLPAPLYFISSADQQLWRLERDGGTLRQVTRLSTPLEAYDVSPLDGTLAYITNNQLWLAEADGGNPRLLVDGGACDSSTTAAYWRRCLRGVVWFPNGNQLAIGLNGVNLVNPQDGSQFKIALNQIDEYYTPVRISPDGNYIVLETVSNSLTPYIAIVPVWGGMVVARNARACCQLDFTPNGIYLLLGGNSLTNGSQPGLWRVNLNSGAVNILVNGEQQNATLAFPHLSADGQQVWYFGMLATYSQDMPTFLAVGPIGDALNGRTEWSGHPRVAYFPYIYEALWAPDGSLVIIAYNNPAAPYAVVDVLGGNLYPLPNLGGNLRWGKS